MKKIASLLPLWGWFAFWATIGFFVFVFLPWKENSSCSPEQPPTWRVEGKTYPSPKQNEPQRHEYSATQKDNPGQTHKYFCKDFRLTDWALVYFTYILGLIGALTLRSADINTKRKERAYMTAAGLYGIPRERWKDTWEIKNRAKAHMFTGPWRMAIRNLGETAGFTQKVEYGLCPKAIFDHEYLRAKSKIRRLLDDPKFCEFRCKWLKPAIEIQDIFLPSEPLHYRHVTFTDEEKRIGDVFFGRITYSDVFGDIHRSAFAIEIVEDHTNGITLNEET